MEQLLIYDDSESYVQDYKEEDRIDDLKLPEITEEDIERNRRVQIKQRESDFLYVKGIEEIDGRPVLIIGVATPVPDLKSQDEIKRVMLKQPGAGAYQIYHKFEKGGSLKEAPIGRWYYDPPVSDTDPELIRLRTVSKEDQKWYEDNERNPVTRRYKRRLIQIEGRLLKAAKQDITLSKDVSLDIIRNECDRCRLAEKCWNPDYEYSMLYNDRHLCFKRCKLASETGPSGQIFDTQVWLYIPRMKNVMKRDSQKDEIMDVLMDADSGLTQAEVRQVTGIPTGTVPKRLRELQQAGLVERDHLTKKFHVTA